jgi:hypothetical protein
MFQVQSSLHCYTCLALQNLDLLKKPALAGNKFKYAIHTRISGFLDFIHRPVFAGTRCFGNWICFHPQVKRGKKTPIQLGPL